MSTLQGQDYLQEEVQKRDVLQEGMKNKEKGAKLFRFLFLLCSFCALMAFAFYVNRHIHIKAL